MQVSFHLRKDKINKVGLAPIRLLISANGFKIFKVVSGLKVKESQWDKKNERIKPPKKNEEYNYHIEYNKKLDELEDKAKTIFRYILLNNITPTKDFILDRLQRVENAELSFDFFPCFDDFIVKNKLVKAERTTTSYTQLYILS